MDRPPLLQLSGVRRTFGERVAVASLDLAVHPGEVVGLLGPNGAGKTTTVRILTGLLEPDAGTVHIGGLDLATDPLGARRHLALVPDGAPLYPNLSLDQHMDLVLGLRGRPLEGTDRASVVRGLGLEGRSAEALGGYSRGMRQRAALALALCSDAGLLVLDEPLTGLDAPGAALVKELLRQWADRGGAVLYTSHLLDVVERVCDRMVILAEGEVVAEGTLEDLTRQAGTGGTLEQVFTALARSEDPAAAAGRLLDELGR